MTALINGPFHCWQPTWNILELPLLVKAFALYKCNGSTNAIKKNNSRRNYFSHNDTRGSKQKLVNSRRVSGTVKPFELVPEDYKLRMIRFTFPDHLQPDLYQLNKGESCLSASLCNLCFECTALPIIFLLVPSMIWIDRNHPASGISNAQQICFEVLRRSRKNDPLNYTWKQCSKLIKSAEQTRIVTELAFFRLCFLIGNRVPHIHIILSICNLRHTEACAPLRPSTLQSTSPVCYRHSFKKGDGVSCSTFHNSNIRSLSAPLERMSHDA